MPGKGWIPVNVKDARGNVIDDREADYLNQISEEQRVLLGPQGALRDNQPVFYLMERGKLVLFGHTMMMRIPYRNSPLNTLPAELRQDDVIYLERGLVEVVVQQRHFAVGRDVGDGHHAVELTVVENDVAWTKLGCDELHETTSAPAAAEPRQRRWPAPASRPRGDR